MISMLAVAETFLSVALLWWLAITFDTYLHLWLAIGAAPLVLLRSPASIEHGANLFMRYWETENSNGDPLPFAPMVFLAAFASGLLAWVLADHWLLADTGPASFWRAVILGLAASNIGMAIAVAAWGFRALTDDKAAAAAVAGVATLAAMVPAMVAAASPDLKIGAMVGVGGATATILLALTIAGLSIDKALVGRVMRGIGVAAVFVTFGFSIVGEMFGGEAAKRILAAIWLAGWVFCAMAAVGGLVGTRGLALVATGAGVGRFSIQTRHLFYGAGPRLGFCSRGIFVADC